jgi:hypothetical protein
MTETIQSVPDKEDLMSFVRVISTPSKDMPEKWEPQNNMQDLWDFVIQYFYSLHAKGSNSIKDILPAVIKSSPYLREKYSQPIYATEVIPSLNFKEPHIWIDETKDSNPYKTLPELFDEKVIEELELEGNLENLDKVLGVLNEGRDYNSYVKTETDIEIEEICKEVFQEFLTDYSMSMFFNPGLWIPKFHGWFSIYTWNSIKGEVGELANVDHPKCLQISILNEHWDQSLGKSGQDEIYLDDESEIKFNQCIETLKSYLSQEIDLIDIKRTELIPTAWQIQIHITYKD